METDKLPRSDRRRFFKTAGGAAVVLLAAKSSRGSSTAKIAHTQDAPPDRGLWVTWYDLAEDGKDAYFAWLHQSYLPSVLKRPGYLWAASYATRINPPREGGSRGGASPIHHVEDPKVGAGFHYILLIGATDADVFGNPTPTQLHASLSEQDRKMLAMRLGERVNLMTEAGRLQGRAARTYKDGMVGAPCIQIGSFNCPVEYEEEMHGGYVQLRLPAQSATESCIRTRKLNSVAGWAKHAILYEYTSLEGFNRDYEAANAKSPLGLGGHNVVPMLIHAPNGPNSAVRVWPPVSPPRA